MDKQMHMLQQLINYEKNQAIELKLMNEKIDKATRHLNDISTSLETIADAYKFALRIPEESIGEQQRKCCDGDCQCNITSACVDKEKASNDYKMFMEGTIKDSLNVAQSTGNNPNMCGSDC